MTGTRLYTPIPGHPTPPAQPFLHTDPSSAGAGLGFSGYCMESTPPQQQDCLSTVNFYRRPELHPIVDQQERRPETRMIMARLCQNFLLRPLQRHGLGHTGILKLPVKLRHKV